jgi:hypothetical protein
MPVFGLVSFVNSCNSSLLAFLSNGGFVFSSEMKALYCFLKEVKPSEKINEHFAYLFDYEHNEVNIYTDSGRLTRPIYYIEHGKESFNRKEIIDLIKKGSLNAGQELIWNRRVAKQIHLATVNQDGSITTADGVKHKTPSGAAKHLNGNKPVDGWLAWKIKSTGVSLASMREAK